MKTLFSSLALKLALLLVPLTGSAQTAEQIMADVRQVAGLQQEQDLHGHMKGNGKKVPMSMLLRGEEIHFQIDEGKEAFALRLLPNQQQLFETTGNRVREFPPGKLAEPIAGTNVSYEDLALKFLYWPNPRIAGEASIKGQACWRIHLRNPEKAGRYREVSAWIAKDQRALLKAIGYGPAPERQALKQFEVTDIQKRKGVWTPRKLRVSEFRNGRASGVTTIDFGRPKRRSRR